MMKDCVPQDLQGSERDCERLRTELHVVKDENEQLRAVEPNPVASIMCQQLQQDVQRLQADNARLTQQRDDAIFQYDGLLGAAEEPR